jgi:hypothetical protein
VDRYALLYGGEHYLEWNWQNAGHGAACGFDFDGVLCHDCPPEDDDDGPRYARFLAGARPLYLPRRLPVPLIVTARHEKYRAPTEDWLRRHGVRWDRLVMRDFAIDPTRWADHVAEFKAYHLDRSTCILMAESDPAQAATINRITRKPVLCPAAGKVFPAAEQPRFPDPPASPPTALQDRLALVWECDYRGPAVGCSCAAVRLCGLARGPTASRPSEVSTADCLRCVSLKSRPSKS